jgi:hypothetical protein
MNTTYTKPEADQNIVLLLNHLTTNTEEVTWANAHRLLIEHQPEIRKHAVSVRLATYYIGSDSYAKEVESVEFYQSGARRGEVKAITTKKGYRFTLRKDGRLRPEGGESGSLVIGVARDYRDPSF